MNLPIFPPEASKVAEQIDNLYWGLLCLGAATCLACLSP